MSSGSGGGRSSVGGPEVSLVAVDWWTVPRDCWTLLCMPVSVDCLLLDCCCGGVRQHSNQDRRCIIKICKMEIQVVFMSEVSGLTVLLGLKRSAVNWYR